MMLIEQIECIPGLQEVNLLLVGREYKPGLKSKN